MQIYLGVFDGFKVWQVSGLKMGVVINKLGMFIEVLFDCMGMIDYFDVIVFGDIMVYKKLYFELIFYVCWLFNVWLDCNLYIGDLKYDIYVVYVVGCLVYVVFYGYNEGELVDSVECDVLVFDLFVVY